LSATCFHVEYGAIFRAGLSATAGLSDSSPLVAQ